MPTEHKEQVKDTQSIPCKKKEVIREVGTTPEQFLEYQRLAAEGELAIIILNHPTRNLSYDEAAYILSISTVGVGILDNPPEPNAPVAKS